MGSFGYTNLQEYYDTLGEVWKEEIIGILSEYKSKLQLDDDRVDILGSRLQQVSPVTFVLMDFNVDAAIQQLVKRQTRETQVYPNPAKNVSTIEYEVRKTGPVKIEVLNKDGQLIRKVLDETQDKGKHSLTIDLTGMRSSFYYYVITDVEGSSTHRFLIQNVK